MEKIEIKNTQVQVLVTDACIDHSTFTGTSLQQVLFDDINMTGAKIVNANLTGLEIEDAQLGGAYIHNIGISLEGHPLYNPNAEQQPIRFEDCNLSNSSIVNCDLRNVVMNECNVSGLIINGIPIGDLLREYKK